MIVSISLVPYMWIETYPLIYNSVNQRYSSDINLYYLVLCYMNQLPGTAHVAMFIKCIEIMGTE